MKKWIGVLAIFIILISIPQYISSKQKSVLKKPQVQQRQQSQQKQAPKADPKPSSNQKEISLTFDDGPDPVFTPQVLKILKQHKAHATFFLLGKNVEKHPELVRKILDADCEIGIHAYEHVPLTKLTQAQIQSQINRTYQLIYNATGYKPVLFRPPFGFANQKVLSAASKKGLRVIRWSDHSDPKDFSQPGTKNIVKTVLDSAAPGNIVLLHDHGTDRTQTVKAIDKIMTELNSKGYRFVTVSTLLKNPKYQDHIQN